MKDILSEIIANKRFEVTCKAGYFYRTITGRYQRISDSPLYEAGISLLPHQVLSPSSSGALLPKDGYKKKRVRKRSFPPMQRQVPPPFPSLLMRSFSEEA